MGARRSLVVCGAVAAAALAAAAGSLLLLPPAIGYDPLNWVIWGREIAHGTLDTRGGTAWKPLPVAFTVLLAPAGRTAPVLWLVVVRAAALVALAGAVRAGVRLAGLAAGLVAGTALALLGQGLVSAWTGTGDWLLLAPAAWAVDAALAGRRLRAFALISVAGLVRPEAWPFMALAGLWVLRERRDRLPLVLTLGLLVPLAWVVPQWIGSGSPFAGQRTVLASPSARAVRDAAEPWRLVLWRFRRLTGGWVLLTAAVGALLGLARRRPQAAMLLGGAAAWVGVVAAMAEAGYPGLQRFMLPAALAVCLAAGAALGHFISLRLGVRPPAALLGAVLVAAWLVPVLGRGVPNLRRQERMGEAAVATQAQFATAVARAGGPASVLGCGAPRTWWAAVPLMHWTLGEGLERPRRGGLVILRQRLHRSAYEPVMPRRARLRLLAADRDWELQGLCGGGRRTAAIVRSITHAPGSHALHG